MKRFLLAIALGLLVSTSACTTTGPAARTAPRAAGPTIWAVNDSEKVKQDDLVNPNMAGNSAWDGKTVKIFGGRNEVIAFQVIVEGGAKGIASLSAALPELRFTGETRETVPPITYKAPATDPTQYAGRPIQLFSENYMKVDAATPANWIVGRRPDGQPKNMLGMIPVQLVPENATAGKGGFPVKVEANKNQAFWIEVYVGRNQAAGPYAGNVEITGDGVKTLVPVQLQVFNFTLPDENSMRAMFYFDLGQVEKWYQQQPLGAEYDRFAHRQRVEFVTDTAEEDLAKFPGRFSGKAFTPEQGYEGPGQGVGNRIVPATFYGPGNKFDEKESAWKESDRWINLLKEKAPNAITFVYMPDEPGANKFPGIIKIGENLHSNPGPGKALGTLVTHGYTDQLADAIDIWCTGPRAFNITKAPDVLKQGKKWWVYNGGRPAAGAMIIDSPATDCRMMPWACYKHGIEVYFYWYSDQWRHNSQKQGERRQNVWANPITFDDRGQPGKPLSGQAFANGDGVLIYPGTEKIHPEEDRGIPGPCSTIQMGNFRRGLQDHQYLTMARQLGLNEVVDEALKATVPQVFSAAPAEGVGFAENGNAYEQARLKLAQAIAAAKGK